MSRLAVVTGGTRGIGAATCLALKAKGNKVAAIYGHNDEAANEFARKNGVKVYKCDVADFKLCHKTIDKITEDFKKSPEILVNNAGIIRDSVLHKMPEETWHKVINTNLDSCYNMCHAVMTQMRDAGFGRIVNISSINALAGQFGQANYSAAKAGILGLTRALAKEGAAKGVTVNAVAPGYIKTDMTDAVPAGVMDSIVAQIPVRRLGRPHEIARVVAFLTDDDSGFITGETVSANGGQFIG